MALCITDGYTEEDEFPGQHWIPKFKFKYRPALSTRQAEWQSVTANANAIAVRAENVKICRDHLTSFEIVDKNGGPFSPADDKIYDRIPLPVIEFMASCILHYGPNREAADLKNSVSP